MAVNFCNYIHCPAGIAWGPRVLKDSELIYFVSGTALWLPEGGESIRIPPHRVLLIPPRLRHTLRCEVASVISCIHFDGEETSWQVYQPDSAEAARLYALFRACAGEFEGALPERGELLNLMTGEIRLRLRRLIRPGGGGRSGLLENLTGYIDAHLTEKLNRRMLAERFRVTPEHVNYLFRSRLGITPSGFINRQKVYRAYELLLTGNAPVKEIAAAVGFDDEYYFGRVFKRITGVSPGRIRTGG